MNVEHRAGGHEKPLAFEPDPAVNPGSSQQALAAVKAGTLSVQSSSDGDEAVVAGRCPRCRHTFRDAVALANPMGGLAGIDAAPYVQTGPVDLVFRCTCSDPHPGRPEKIASGCGFAFRFTLNPEG